jgi:CheY-like chemotaxis protein
MSLILAVEPDRQQAKQLSALVRQHIRAELVVADSGAAALEALADRIPDLILTPALLPPKDEAVLTSWLRDLGEVAAHVQTLAIPILADADAKGREPSSSIFGRLRDPQPAQSQGCDHGVFAEQVRVYLDRAGVDRSSRVQPEPSETVPVIAAAEDDAPELDDFDEAVTFDDLVFDPNPGSDSAPAPAPVPVPEPPVVMRMPTPFARPDKRVDSTMARSREAEPVSEATPTTAPPLWRVDSNRPEDATPPATQAAELSFDPDDARYAPLFRRLDELAAQHA